MQFIVPSADFTFDIPDDWWSFAEMQDFRPKASSYCLPIAAFSDRVDIEIVPINAVAPPWERMATQPTIAKTRIVPILLALRGGGELPPVQIKRILNDRYRFQLVDGFHRYCASIAAGFQEIPGVFHEISWCKPDHGRKAPSTSAQ